MEAGDRATGHGDKHHGPHRQSFGMYHGERGGCQLGQLIGGVDQDRPRDPQRHDDQADAENRVDLSDDLVDGEKRCQQIVDQDDCQPE